MSRRRRKPKGPHTEPGRPAAAPAVPSVATRNSPDVPAELTAAVDKAIELAKGELGGTGRITPKAIFVYPEPAPKTTVVSLSFRGELHRDVLEARIKDKAVQEGASVVVVTSVTPARGGGTLVVSGMTAGAEFTASIDYAYDVRTSAVSRWDLR